MTIPKADKGKVVVIYAELKTGIILNLDNTYYSGVGENYYLVVDNLQLARKQAVEAISQSNNSIEVLLYDNEGIFIDRMR